MDKQSILVDPNEVIFVASHAANYRLRVNEECKMLVSVLKGQLDDHRYQESVNERKAWRISMM